MHPKQKDPLRQQQASETISESHYTAELQAAHQTQEDAEFSRELAADIVTMIAAAVATLSLDSLRILQAYIRKSLELMGVEV